MRVLVFLSSGLSISLIEALKRPAWAEQAVKILLVDDDEDVRAYAVSVLTEAGYDVQSVARAAEAETLFSAGMHFDLLITDVVMPGCSGIDLARRLHNVQPHAQVLFATGYTRHIAPDELTFAEVLDKPYQADALIHTVRRLVGDRSRC